MFFVDFSREMKPGVRSVALASQLKVNPGDLRMSMLGKFAEAVGFQSTSSHLGEIAWNENSE